MDKKHIYMLIGIAVFMLAVGTVIILINKPFDRNGLTRDSLKDSFENPTDPDEGSGWNVKVFGYEDEDSEPEGNNDDLAECMVRINAGTNAASGMVWDIEEDYVIICTAKHVVEESYESEITFADGRCGTAKSVYYSTEHDVAFLKLDAETNPQFDFREMKKASVSGEEKGEELYTGQKICIVASKSGPGEDSGNGIVSQESFFAQDFNDWLILIDCEIKPGYSGGGIFTKDGQLLGMVVGSDGEYGVCVPKSVIIDEYRNKINQEKKETEEIKDDED